MANSVKIYQLIDPINGLPRYIGKTNCDLCKRLARHLVDRNRNHRTNWIRQLKNNGLMPIIELIDEVSQSNWQFWEKYWISQYKTWGFNLVNATDGGEGVEDSTGAIAAKISKSQKGVPNKPISEETRKRMSLVKIGKKHTEEARKNMSIAQKSLKKVLSAETRGKISKAKAGIDVKPKGFKHTEETKEKISRVQMGRKLSNETKNKMSIGNKRAWVERKKLN